MLIKRERKSARCPVSRTVNEKVFSFQRVIGFHELLIISNWEVVISFFFFLSKSAHVVKDEDCCVPAPASHRARLLTSLARVCEVWSASFGQFRGEFFVVMAELLVELLAPGENLRLRGRSHQRYSWWIYCSFRRQVSMLYWLKIKDSNFCLLVVACSIVIVPCFFHFRSFDNLVSWFQFNSS